MRRKDREVHEHEQICNILKECRIMHLGIRGDPYPYVVPLNYGYQFKDNQLTLYFHCAKQGRKIDLLKTNPLVAFAIDGVYDLITHDIACKNTILYKSIMGEGKAEFIDTEDEKLKLLS